MPLKIGAGDVEHIHDHAKEAYPEECSGVMVGMQAEGMKIVVDVWRAENVEEMRSWVLRDDRSGYDEEPILG